MEQKSTASCLATGHDINLGAFAVFDGLLPEELALVAGMAELMAVDADVVLFRAGTPANYLYVIIEGRVAVFIEDADTEQLVDEVEEGDALGWSSVAAPYIYTASARTLDSTRLLRVNGIQLRQACEQSLHLGCVVSRNINAILSRRYGRAIGGAQDLKPKDLRAFSGEERTVWREKDIVLTTEVIIIGVGKKRPEVVPLEAVYDAEIENQRVVLRAKGGDVRLPRVKNPAMIARLVREELRRFRLASRRVG